MARIDDYSNAKKIAVAKLENYKLKTIAQNSGLTLLDEDTLRVDFLDRAYRIRYPGFDFEDEAKNAKEVPLQEQVLILHYMIGCRSQKATGVWISYREIPGAAFYFSAFVKRAIDPVKKIFGTNAAGIVNPALALKGTTIETGDAGFEFSILPKTPMQLILWEGDDEFPAEANIVFDEIVGKVLSPEDAAWLAGMLVYRLIAISYR